MLYWRDHLRPASSCIWVNTVDDEVYLEIYADMAKYVSYYPNAEKSHDIKIVFSLKMW